MLQPPRIIRVQTTPKTLAAETRARSHRGVAVKFAEGYFLFDGKRLWIIERYIPRHWHYAPENPTSTTGSAIVFSPTINADTLTEAVMYIMAMGVSS